MNSVKYFIIKCISWRDRLITSRCYRKNVKRALKKQSIHSQTLSKDEKLEFKKNWKQFDYYDYRWHLFFKNEFGFDKNFVPIDLFHYLIEPILNPVEHIFLIQNKGLYNFFFPQFLQPECFVKNIDGMFYDNDMNLLSKEEALILVHDIGKNFIIKPTIDSARGEGVLLIDIDEWGDKIEILFDKYIKNFIIQEVIEQSEEMAYFNASSLNTIRVLSLFLNGNATILDSFLRYGKGNSNVDNLCAGGIAVGIKPDGYLNIYGIESNSIKVYKTQSGDSFADIKIHFYESLMTKIIAMHKKMPLCPLISWDIAVNKQKQFVMIEVNLVSQAAYFHQYISGKPLFKERTEEVLQYVRECGIKNILLRK